MKAIAELRAAAKGKLTAEDVAYWYLRLNGFLLLNNFIVHGDRKEGPRTEIDQLGVRFRYRREHLVQPMMDDEWIEQANRTIVVFCDAKEGPQDFNDTWTTNSRKVMESFLALVGVMPSDCWDHVARDLYDCGFSRPKADLLVTTLLIHEDKDRKVQPRWPQAPRIQLTDALRFIHKRFYNFHNPKEAHGQWKPSGHRLWNLYDNHKHDEARFVSEVAREIGAI